MGRKSREMTLVQYAAHFERKNNKLNEQMSSVASKGQAWWKLRKQQIALEARLRMRWLNFDKPRQIVQLKHAMEVIIERSLLALHENKRS